MTRGNGTGVLRAVVVGGGLTGLSGAYYLKKECERLGVPLRLTVVDAARSPGGKIDTLRKDGFVIERGPDSFLARKLPMWELAKSLGLEDELTGTNPEAKKTYILKGGQLHPMPPGLVLGIPTDWAAFLKSGLVSEAGKLTASLDFVTPARPSAAEPGRPEADDESLGDFLTRRLGREVLEHIAEPLLAGIYAGDTFELSLQSTFPQFRQAELEHGSLIRGMAASLRAQAAPSPLPERLRGTMFLTFRRGLGSLVEALERELAGSLATGVRVDAIGKARAEGDDKFTYALRLSNGETLEADAVLLAVPNGEIASLLSPHDSRVGELGRTPYVSVANVILGLKAEDAPRQLDGSGFVVSRAEGRFITAATWTSAKWLHTAPRDKLLIRSYVGRAGREEWQQMDDEEIVRRVRSDLREVMGLTAEPEFAYVTRLPQSMPQYRVGHLGLLRDVRESMARTLPGVWIAGAGLEGVGLPDCIRQGRDAAAQMAKRAAEALLASQ